MYRKEEKATETNRLEMLKEQYSTRPGDEYTLRPADQYTVRPGDEYEGRPADDYKGVEGAYSGEMIDSQYPDDVQVTLKDSIRNVNRDRQDKTT